MAPRGLSFREVNIRRTVVLPLVVAGAALAMAIVGRRRSWQRCRHRQNQRVRRQLGPSSPANPVCMRHNRRTLADCLSRLL